MVGLQYGYGRCVPTTEAEQQPVAQLAVDNPFILVRLPVGLPVHPPYVHELRGEISDLEAWKLTTSQTT